MNNTLNSNKIIKCLQINMQRSKVVTANLIRTIEDLNIDIILAQEPYVIKRKVCGIPLNLKTIFCDLGEKPKTAIIIANKSLQVINVCTYTCDNATFAYIQFLNNSITFCSAYCPPLKDIKIELNLISNVIIKLKPNNLIISMDTNAHSRNWFNNSEDARGDTLNDFLAQNNLILHNDNEGNPTFHTIRNGRVYQSSIDLTISDINASLLIKN